MSAALGAAARGDRFTDLSRVLGGTPESGEIDAALIAAWERTFDATMQPGELTQRESAAAEELRATKYASERWTLSP